MDQTTEQLVDYSIEFSESEVSGQVLEAALLHLVDSIACAIAGSKSPPALAASRVARTISAPLGASVFGSGILTSPEMAAFANTVMVRAWDWNDGMLARGGGHPSDMIGGLLAAGEAVRASGVEVVAALTLSYELLGALGDSAPVRDRGWDQGTFMGAATALGVGRLLGLDRDQLGNAVSLSVVPNVPLRVSRTGRLSMWKGCATAAAVRNAIFAVKLAKEGITGPEEPFEGKTALWEQVTGPFAVNLPAYPDGKRVVQLSHMKQFPAETHSQALMGLVPEIQQWTSLDEIESIAIEIYWQAYHEIGMDPTRWDPKNRETADHSLPFLLAAALVDGTINLQTFSPERIADPDLRPLMNKISIAENPEFTAMFRPPGASISGEPRARIRIETASGRVFDRVVDYAKGHSLNPMSREDVADKFDAASEGIISLERAAEIREAWWDVANADDISVPIRLTTGF